MDGRRANVDVRPANVDVRPANVDVRPANVDVRSPNAVRKPSEKRGMPAYQKKFPWVSPMTKSFRRLQNKHAHVDVAVFLLLIVSVSS